MKSIWLAMLIVASSLLAFDVRATSLAKVGEEYEITKSYETSKETSDGSSSGSSSGRDTILERVIGVRDSGLKLEYDLPRDATAEDRARNWQFPARVFRPSSGPMQLLNSSDLESRLESWLKKAKWTRQICGRWIFTWNAFRIACDPQSVIRTIEAFDLRSIKLSDGAPFQVSGGRSPATLKRTSAGPNGATFEVVAEVDPEAVRHSRAESDVVVAEIMQKPVTLETALRERANDTISGTISVTFNTDPAGNVLRQTRVTKLQTKRAKGPTETETITETVERHVVTS